MWNYNIKINKIVFKRIYVNIELLTRYCDDVLVILVYDIYPNALNSYQVWKKSKVGVGSLIDTTQVHNLLKCLFFPWYGECL